MQTIWTKKSIKFGLLFWKLWLRSAQLLWRRYALHRVPSSFVWFCTSTIKSYLQESYFYSVLICFYSDSVSSAQPLIVSGRRVGNIGLWSAPDYRRRLAWCVSAELSKYWAAASGAEDSRPWGELEAKISGISAGSLAMRCRRPICPHSDAHMCSGTEEGRCSLDEDDNAVISPSLGHRRRSRDNNWAAADTVHSRIERYVH